MKKTIILLLVLSLRIGGCGQMSNKEGTVDKPSMALTHACEHIRSSDPSIRIKAIDEFVKDGSLQSELMLYYWWIEEDDKSIRERILHFFTKDKMGEYYPGVTERYLPGWIKAINKMLPEERKTRLNELKKYFPDEFEKQKKSDKNSLEMPQEDIGRLKEADEKHNKGKELLNEAIRKIKDQDLKNKKINEAEKNLRGAIRIYEQLHAKYKYKEIEERLMQANRSLYFTLKLRTL